VEPLARYWVEEAMVDNALAGKWDRGWLLGWRKITNSMNERSLVPFLFPKSAAGDSAYMMHSRLGPPAVLLATLSSMVLDYVARQKLSGSNMLYFMVSQLAVPAPASVAAVPPWLDRALSDWLLPRVLELVYTSYRIEPFAQDLRDDDPPFQWMPERRATIRAEIDAAMFHVYGLARDEVEHVLDSFLVVRRYEERDHGEFRTKRLVLAEYDVMSTSAATGVPYHSPLDPPPGEGPRHSGRTS